MKNQNIPNKDLNKSSQAGQSEQASSRDSLNQNRFEKDTSVKNSSSQSNLNKATSKQQGQR